MVNKIVIGTRGSELARAQARMVEEELREKWPDLAIETKIIRTGGDESHPKTGDMRQGRKGLFTAEIERALLSGDVDVAVHSAKDLPSETNPSAEIAAVLPRAPMDDVLVAKPPGCFATNTSSIGARGRTAAISALGFVSLGKSFALCTATSTSPERRARSISAVNSPFRPWRMSPVFGCDSSPPVRMIFVSIARSGHFSR